MPHLHNGIGTWYLGKSNIKVSEGRCEFCGKWGNLATYETRLWILVFFVPVIPLGKKQILDDCPNCRRHRQMSLAKWKEIEANALREAMQKADANPSDSAAMLELLGTMIGFRRTEEAKKLADVLEADFPDNFDVQMQLGTWHAAEGRADKARPCLRRGLELKPDDAYAKNMVALGYIDEGDLPRARELLRGLDVPGGPQQAPQSMLVLANAYQMQGDHAAALEFYGIAIEMVPAFAQDKALRKRIRASEEALGKTESILPKRKFKLGKPMIAAAVVLALVLGFFGFNFYKAKNQSLHVVNGFAQPVRVSIDGGKTHEVPAGSRYVIHVAEGQRRALVEQPGEPAETIDFDVHNGFFERFSNDSVFILNPGGMGTILRLEKMYFPKNNMPANPGPQIYQIHFGQKFFEFRNIDYPFTDPPKEITMKEHARMEKKTVLEVVNESPRAVLQAFPAGTPKSTLADYLELHLKQHRDDTDLLGAYLGILASENQLDRCFRYLAGGLDKKPLSVEWHRSYQTIGEMTDHREALEADYRKRLEAAPDDSTLQYLLARVLADPKEARKLFEKSMQSDPQNAYPKYALAHGHLTSGDFAKARPLAEAACKLKPDSWDMADLFYQVRFALHEYQPLEQEMRDTLAAKPYDSTTLDRLMQVQAARDGLDRAKMSYDDFASRVEQVSRTTSDPTVSQLALRGKISLLYLKGDLEGILEESKAFNLSPELSSAYAYMAHLELGHVSDAESSLTANPDGKIPEESMLLMFLAWSKQKNRERADDWRHKAIEKFRKGQDEFRPVADMLEKGKADLDELADMPLQARQKSVVLTALAELDKEHRKELLALAEKLDFDTYFPHRFLRKIIEKMKAEK